MLHACGPHVRVVARQALIPAHSISQPLSPHWIVVLLQLLFPEQSMKHGQPSGQTNPELHWLSRQVIVQVPPSQPPVHSGGHAPIPGGTGSQLPAPPSELEPPEVEPESSEPAEVIVPGPVIVVIPSSPVVEDGGGGGGGGGEGEPVSSPELPESASVIPPPGEPVVPSGSANRAASPPPPWEHAPNPNVRPKARPSSSSSPIPRRPHSVTVPRRVAIRVHPPPSDDVVGPRRACSCKKCSYGSRAP